MTSGAWKHLLWQANYFPSLYSSVFSSSFVFFSLISCACLFCFVCIVPGMMDRNLCFKPFSDVKLSDLFLYLNIYSRFRVSSPSFWTTWAKLLFLQLFILVETNRMRVSIDLIPNTIDFKSIDASNLSFNFLWRLQKIKNHSFNFLKVKEKTF